MFSGIDSFFQIYIFFGVVSIAQKFFHGFSIVFDGVFLSFLSSAFLFVEFGTHLLKLGDA